MLEIAGTPVNPLPALYYGSRNINNSSDCPVRQEPEPNGTWPTVTVALTVPSENVPVLSLTETTTTMLHGPAMGHASPPKTMTSFPTSVTAPLVRSSSPMTSKGADVTRPSHSMTTAPLIPTPAGTLKPSPYTATPSKQGLQLGVPSHSVGVDPQSIEDIKEHLLGVLASTDATALTFSRGLGPDLVLGTQTITPGAPAVMISGTPVSLASDGTAIVIGSTTKPLPAAPMQGIVTAGALTFRRGSGSDLVIGTQTIMAGAPAVTISGTPVSLPVGGTAVVVDGSTIQLSGPTPAPTTVPVILDVNGMPLTALSGFNYIVGSQTLVPGKPAITVNGTPVSLAIDGTAVVAGDSTIQLSTATPVVLDINGVSLTALPGSNYIVGSQTLIPGGPAINVDGTPVSLAVSATAVVVGGSTVPLSGASTTPAVLAINGNTYTGISGSTFLIGSQTLIPGGSAITVSGTPVSLPLDATAVVVGGSTFPLPNPATTTPTVLTIGGNRYTEMSGSSFLIGSQTLIPGGPAITISGTPISLPVGATAVVVGSSTFPLPGPTTTAPPVLTINGERYTEMSGSTFLVGSQTLVPGGSAITLSGTPISLPLGATAVVVAGSTVPIPRPTTTPVVLEIDGQSFTQISRSGFLIGSQTLLPGGAAITVNGTLVSLGPAATNLVVGTHTEPLTTSRGLGEIIMGGFSNGGPGLPGATNTSSVAGFTGGTHRGVERRLGSMCVGVVLGCVLANFF